MNAEQIYKHTFEQLGAGDNINAKMALELGTKAQSPNIQNICGALRRANAELIEALSINDLKWTSRTDQAIERARAEITNALVLLEVK
jgi:hypothetical protein